MAARTPRRAPGPARRPSAGRAPSRAGAAAVLPPGPTRPARHTRATVAVHAPIRRTPGHTHQGHSRGHTRGQGRGHGHPCDTAGPGHRGAPEVEKDAGGRARRALTDGDHEVAATGRARGLPVDPHGAHDITTMVAEAAVHIVALVLLALPDLITTTHCHRLHPTT